MSGAPGSVPPTLGVILAGGLSRRMGGGDKPLLRLGEKTLLERVAERLGPQCSAGLILNANGDAGRFRAFTGFVVADSVPDAPGPLAGVLAALDFCASHHPDVTYVASVAGDTPFLPHDLVARLHAARARDGVAMAVAASGGQLHFVNGLWAVSLRHDLRTALVERGLRRVGMWIARHNASEAAWETDPVDPFLNLNTPEDVFAAERLLADEARPGIQ
ncbi:molybdopterin-guanine dinucleotide biosynthesis protein A [Methylobacterium sp. ap11]|uniref:molybdenum cofactor guanylyltransferase MobA n=1 Tax=Methylobacterium sp. ap11 TaxID=1761799 RepID=UPI0008D14F26|nr:molybdenum cofactor guanylyltransferase MobA [Methylobacterium sp. ap11]SEO73999.1 molybdopterin-guanine dinucleotide biosynthesis protein A [Methylobacterium sp. ap11]